MQIQIKPWGNSQGIILSKAVMATAGIDCNDLLDLVVREGEIILRKPFRHKTLAERIKESGVPLTLTGEMDYGEPMGREIW